MAISRATEDRRYGVFLLLVGIPAMITGIFVGIHYDDPGLMIGAPLVGLLALYTSFSLLFPRK